MAGSSRKALLAKARAAPSISATPNPTRPPIAASPPKPRRHALSLPEQCGCHFSHCHYHHCGTALLLPLVILLAAFFSWRPCLMPMSSLAASLVLPLPDYYSAASLSREASAMDFGFAKLVSPTCLEYKLVDLGPVRHAQLVNPQLATTPLPPLRVLNL